jgi:hypothetical protein
LCGKHGSLWSHWLIALRMPAPLAWPPGRLALKAAYIPSDTSFIGSFSPLLELYFSPPPGSDERLMRRPCERWPSNCS